MNHNSLILTGIFLFMLCLTRLVAQPINCHRCQNIPNINYTYTLDEDDPIWTNFIKQVNCGPTTYSQLTNYQVTDMTIYNYSYNGFQIYQPFGDLFDQIATTLGPIVPKSQVVNLANLFRKQIEYRLNGNSLISSNNPNYRYVTCVEIQTITYLGLCCELNTGCCDSLDPPLWQINVRVRHGKQGISND